MNHNYNYNRSVFVFIICLIMYGLFLIHIYTIQIKNADFYQNLAHKQYNVTMLKHPDRGMFIDRHNKPLTLNKESVSAFVVPKEVIQNPDTLRFLQNNFPEAYEKLHRYAQKSFMFVKRRLSEEESILLHNASCKDIHLLKEQSRFYPYESLAPVLGITDLDNQGLFGLEHQYNTLLLGSPTIYHLQQDAKSQHFYFHQESEEGTTPSNIKITIDADLQYKMFKATEQALQQHEAYEAAVLCMDPETGEVITMISIPSFDPNALTSIDLQHTKNRPVTESFEPGSVIKVFAALAALENKAVTIDELIDCENKKETKIDTLRVRTVIPKGLIPFKDVIIYSNNIGIVKVMKRLQDDLYDYYKKFGFGNYTGINIAGEQKGFVNHPARWSAYSIQSLSYGYEITLNLLQLARAYAMILNGGYLIRPKILYDTPIEKIGPCISPETITDISTILQETVERGTAKKARIQSYTILGKTGTAVLLTNGVYDETKHINTFVGSISHNTYQRVIALYIREPKKATYASVTVAPLFKQLIEILIMHMSYNS